METIGKEAFSYCSELNSVYFPKSVTSFGDDVLSYCPSLETISIEPGNPCCITSNGVLFNSDMTVILCYPAKRAGASYTIPNSVKEIGNYAFCQCKLLNEIVIPYGVEKIGLTAFGYCTGMYNINIPPSVTSIGGGAFSGCSALTDIVIPDSVTFLGSIAFRECTSLKSITLSNNLTIIYGSTFSECKSLESIVIPDSVVSVEDRVFCYCESLKSVTISNSLTSIREYCFLGCTSLENVEIPDNVTGIGYRAFYGCSKLKTVKMPDSLTGIASEAFINCRTLESITLPVGTKTISQDAFSGCKSLQEIVIPKSVNYISDSAFRNCDSVVFYCCMDSYADRYAEKYGIPRIYITDLILSETYLDLSVGSLYTLTYNITPESSKDQSVTWTSDDPSVVTVENGLLRAKDKGKAVITAVTDDGTYEQCTVNVYREVIHQEAVPPTCTEDGTLECWIYENKYYLDEELTQQVFSIIDPATGHDWGEPEYTWDDEYNCTALRICNHDHSHVETETTAGICSVSTQPTCEEDGEEIYTAYFENPSFADQTKEVVIPKTGHNWSEPQYSWQTEDDIFTECYAWRVCENDYEVQEETVNVEYRVTSEPTCECDGEGEYYAVFKNPAFSEQIINEIIPAKGHDWGEPEWTWNGYKTAYALFTCTNDNTHTETVNAEITSKTNAPTCDTDGKTVYTAAVVLDGKTYTDTKTEILKKTEHNWGEPEWTWNGYKTAYAVFTCTNDNTHTETVNAEITSKTTAPTCDTDGKTVYTATVTFNGNTYTDTKTEIIPKTGHSWGKPEWTWESYDTAYAEFTCTNDEAHKEKITAEVTSETTAPTCETDGKTVYTATVKFNGNTYTDTKTKIIPKTGHSWGRPEWTWNGYKTAYAVFTCKNDNSHTKTVNAEIISETTAPTCEADGTTVYTATVLFDGNAYTDTKTEIIPKTGHDWGEPEWTWESYDTAYAVFTCTNDTAHKETVTAEITSKTTAPTCEADGKTVYTATVLFDGNTYTDTKTEIIPKTGHNWSEPEWTWESYDTAYAVFTCTNDTAHKETVTAEITSKTTAPTCEADGKTVYTATVTFNGKTYTDTKTEIIPKTGHDWGEPEWIWESYDTAYAEFTCTNDEAHKETVKAEITSETTPATEEAEGKIVYTATVEFEGKVYTDTKTEIIPKIETDDEPIRYGDVNDDGKVTAKDSLMAQRYAIKLTTLTDKQIKAADVDLDNKITVKDALYILRCSINLVVLPIEK